MDKVETLVSGILDPYNYHSQFQNLMVGMFDQFVAPDQLADFGPDLVSQIEQAFIDGDINLKRYILEDIDDLISDLQRALSAAKD